MQNTGGLGVHQNSRRRIYCFSCYGSGGGQGINGHLRWWKRHFTQCVVGGSMTRLEGDFTAIQQISNGWYRTLKRCYMTRHSLSWHIPKHTRQHEIRILRKPLKILSRTCFSASHHRRGLFSRQKMQTARGVKALFISGPQKRSKGYWERKMQSLLPVCLA